LKKVPPLLYLKNLKKICRINKNHGCIWRKGNLCPEFLSFVQRRFSQPLRFFLKTLQKERKIQAALKNLKKLLAALKNLNRAAMKRKTLAAMLDKGLRSQQIKDVFAQLTTRPQE